MSLLVLLLLLAAGEAAAPAPAPAYRVVFEDGRSLSLREAPRWAFGKAFVTTSEGRRLELAWQQVDHEATRRLNPDRKPSAGRTWTEEDLARLRGQRLTVTGSEAPDPAFGQTQRAAGSSEVLSSSKKPVTEAQWRSRATPLRESIARGEAYVRALDQAAQQWGDFAIATGGDYERAAAQELGRIRRARESAVQQLDRDKRDWARLEEDARRAGALPGWLR